MLAVKKITTNCPSDGYEILSLPLHLFVLLLLVVGYACSDSVNSVKLEPVTIQALDSLSVNEIDTVADSDQLILSTSNGVFAVKDEQAFLAGMQGKTINNLVVLDQQTMLASIPSSGENGATTLFRTTNGGQSWNGFMRNWGGKDKISFVGDLAVDPTNNKRLLGRGMANVVSSSDGGRTWHSMFRKWNTFVANPKFVKINHNDPKVIMGGGSNAVFQPDFFISEDNGETWNHYHNKVQIFEDRHGRFESAVTSLVIKDGDSDNLLISLCCFFSDIFRSEDGGETWEQSFLESREEFLTFDFTYALSVLAASPNDPNTVYASGQNQQGILFYAVTRDFGDTWETIDVPDTPSGISVNDLAVVEHGGRELLLFGTNKGFFRVPVEEN